MPMGESQGFYQVGDDTQNRVLIGFGESQSFIVPVNSGMNFYFGIVSDDFTVSKGSDLTLSVSSFHATPTTAPVVPAPLPAIGAASLFLGSRRLKRRIDRQRVLRMARRNLAPAIR